MTYSVYDKQRFLWAHLLQSWSTSIAFSGQSPIKSKFIRALQRFSYAQSNRDFLRRFAFSVFNCLYLFHINFWEIVVSQHIIANIIVFSQVWNSFRLHQVSDLINFSAKLHICRLKAIAYLFIDSGLYVLDSIVSKLDNVWLLIETEHHSLSHAIDFHLTTVTEMRTWDLYFQWIKWREHALEHWVYNRVMSVWLSFTSSKLREAVQDEKRSDLRFRESFWFSLRVSYVAKR